VKPESIEFWPNTPLLPKELLIEQTQKLRKRLGGQHEKAAVEALEQNDFRTWVELLLVYYDKSYAHFVEKNNLSLRKICMGLEPIRNFIVILH
jgi:hypothetical protein